MTATPNGLDDLTAARERSRTQRPPRHVPPPKYGTAPRQPDAPAVTGDAAPATEVIDLRSKGATEERSEAPEPPVEAPKATTRSKAPRKAAPAGRDELRPAQVYMDPGTTTTSDESAQPR